VAPGLRRNSRLAAVSGAPVVRLALPVVAVHARSLAARFRVAAFDFDGAGASPYGDGNYPGEVAAAAEWARDHGSRKIVLMDASMGGTAVVVAAAHLGGSVAGETGISAKTCLNQ
jgi:pimeloyl-ACP methyl ester carboxylesterase